MKKIITISVIFAILLSFSVWELVYTTKLYKDIYSDLLRVERGIDTADKEKIDTPEIIEDIEKAVNKWKKGKEILFCLGNHTVLRNVDEKLISLEAMIKTNHGEDARVNIKSVISLIEGIHNDSHPVLSNLF